MYETVRELQKGSEKNIKIKAQFHLSSLTPTINLTGPENLLRGEPQLKNSLD